MIKGTTSGPMTRAKHLQNAGGEAAVFAGFRRIGVCKLSTTFVIPFQQ